MTKIFNEQDLYAEVFSTAQNMQRFTQENYPYLAHLVGGTSLSTAGAQYTLTATATTGITSNATALKTVLSSTINWPGLDKLNMDEIEFALSAELSATAVAATTLGFIWQAKNSTATSTQWQNLHAVKKLISTASLTGGARTMSGYRLFRDSTIAAPLNRLPINIRLRFFCKNASAKGKCRVKSSTYVALLSRKTVSV